VLSAAFARLRQAIRDRAISLADKVNKNENKTRKKEIKQKKKEKRIQRSHSSERRREARGSERYEAPAAVRDHWIASSREAPASKGTMRSFLRSSSHRAFPRSSRISSRLTKKKSASMRRAMKMDTRREKHEGRKRKRERERERGRGQCRHRRAPDGSLAG